MKNIKFGKINQLNIVPNKQRIQQNKLIFQTISYQMSRSYQYSYYNKNLTPPTQSHTQLRAPLSPQQTTHTIESLKAQVKQKQSLLIQLSNRIQQQQRLLEQKQFALKQKELQLQYIHKENQELHDKIFHLNQRLNVQRADIKDTIKQQVGMLKEEFNFMIKENQNKTQIILQQKQKQFQRKEEDLKSMIKELSERGSNNGSFYYEESHSNIIKANNMKGSYFSKRNDEFYQNQQEKPSTANSNLRNSRQSYKSNYLEHNKVLTSLRQSIVGQNNKDKILKDRESGNASLSSLMNLKEGGTLSSESQVTGRFGFAKSPITSKYAVRRTIDDNKQTSSRTSSRPNIDEIISRSKRQLNERNKKSSMTDLPKHYPPLSSSGNSRLVRKRNEDLDNSRSSIRYGIDQMDEKRKSQKIKEISSLKMKVNMLKTELKQEISFCQHKE